MGERARGTERSAGALLGPDMLIPAPIRTLSDELADAPPEPEDEGAEPPPRPGLLRRTSRA